VLGLQLGIGIGFRRNHSWSSIFTPRRNHSLCLILLYLTWYLTWCGCTTASTFDFRTCSNVVNLAASGIRGLNVHEELHLLSHRLSRRRRRILLRVYDRPSPTVGKMWILLRINITFYSLQHPQIRISAFRTFAYFITGRFTSAATAQPAR